MPGAEEKGQGGGGLRHHCHCIVFEKEDNLMFIVIKCLCSLDSEARHGAQGKKLIVFQPENQ